MGRLPDKSPKDAVKLVEKHEEVGSLLECTLNQHVKGSCAARPRHHLEGAPALLRPTEGAPRPNTLSRHPNRSGRVGGETRTAVPG